MPALIAVLGCDLQFSVRSGGFNLAFQA